MKWKCIIISSQFRFGSVVLNKRYQACSFYHDNNYWVVRYLRQVMINSLYRSSFWSWPKWREVNCNIAQKVTNRVCSHCGHHCRYWCLGVSNHRQFDCLFNSLFWLKKKRLNAASLAQIQVIWWYSYVNGGFPSQRANDAESVSMTSSWYLYLCIPADREGGSTPEWKKMVDEKRKDAPFDENHILGQKDKKGRRSSFD